MKLDAGIPRVALVAAAVSLLSACQEKLDTSRTSARIGTLGEDIHYTACRRFASEAYPEDVQGVQTRALCRGEEAAPADDPSLPLAIRALNALAGNRPRLVPALDSSIPEPTHDPLRQLLVDILPLYEAPTELIPAQTRELGAQMDALANDASITAILGRFSARQGYRPARFDLGLARPSLAYSEMPTVIDQVFGAIAPSGYARDSFEQVLTVSSLELATAANDTLDPWQTSSTLTLARTMLLRTAADAHPLLPTFSSGVPRYAIRRDVRGMVLPSPAGAVPAPFADVNPADGLADVDATGHFVDAAGAVLAVPPPFRTNGEDPSVSRDASGRALRADNSLYYQYVDADSTLLGALVREAPPLLDPAQPALLDAAYGLRAMLGTTSTRSETYGATSLSFTGPDPATAPLLDGVHAGVQLLPRADMFDVLTALGALLLGSDTDPGPVVVSGLVNAIRYAADTGDKTYPRPGMAGVNLPEAALTQPNILWDEVLAVLEQTSNGQTVASVANPDEISYARGPLETIMRSLIVPVETKSLNGSSSLGPVTSSVQAMTAILPRFALYRDKISFESNINDPIDVGSDFSQLSQLVDHGAPDTTTSSTTNESLLQRSLHLMADLNGAELCNKEGALIETLASAYLQPSPGHETVDPSDNPNAFRRCGAIRIRNMASAYARSILGRYVVEFTEPTLLAIVNNGSGDVVVDPPGVLPPFAVNVKLNRTGPLDIVLNEMLETNSGITGFTSKPTAEAMARFVFTDRNAWLDAQFDPPQTNDGRNVEDVHCLSRTGGPGTNCTDAVIFAWEKPIPVSGSASVRFIDALVPLLTALDDGDADLDADARVGLGFPDSGSATTADMDDNNDTIVDYKSTFRFGDLGEALHRHWASTAASVTRTQNDDPNAAGFSFQDNVRSYEPIIADAIGTGRLLAAIATAVGALDTINVSKKPPSAPFFYFPRTPSTSTTQDGVHAMARTAEFALRGNAALTYRDGRNHICYNDGVCYDGAGGRALRSPSPFYMLLDALDAADDAWTANGDSPSRHDAWLGARATLADQLFTIDTTTPVAPKFANAHARSIVFSILRMLNEQIAAHLAAGNAPAWANSFTTDTSDLVAAPLTGALLDLTEDFYLNASARQTFAALLRYLLAETSPNEGFDSNLLAVIDALYLLEDEASTVPLLHALAPFFATNATTVVASGGTVDTNASLVDSTVTVLNEVDNRDMTHAVSAVLAASVTLPAAGDPEAPLETIGDVIAEVNREAPNAGTPLTAADWALLLASVRDFALAENNGLERLYAVIQNRRLP